MIPTIVLKFGSSVLQRPRDLQQAIHEIYRFKRDGYNVLAVVSAIGDTTDNLVAEARRFSDSPDPVAEAYLLASGEQQSAALLTVAANSAGVPARTIDPREFDFVAEGDVLDAAPCGIDTLKLKSRFADGKVLILPGFFAGHKEHGIALLGRGGSDFSAVYLAAQLGPSKNGAPTRCRLLKDVDGLYERDPALIGADGIAPKRFDFITWDEAIELASQLVQPKAVRFAKAQAQELEVACCGKNRATIIGAAASEKLSNPADLAPIRIALMGLGTVGRALYDHLVGMPDVFEVVGIAVRDKKKHIDAGIPENLIVSNAQGLFARDPQILVEAAGGIDPAYSIIKRALENGIHVASANKQVIAERGVEFARLAAENGAQILYSAAVGGAVPIIESIDLQQPGSIARVDGVVNGTTNFIIDQLANGLSYPDALRQAQDKGFAEADPTADVEGFDAQAKIKICARHAFGVELEDENIDRTGITQLSPNDIITAAKSGKKYRHVARCWLEDGTPKASIKPEVLDQSDILASAVNEGNCAVITLSDGQVINLSGKGAGAGPTAEAVLADVMDVKRLLARQRADMARAGQVKAETTVAAAL